jgi:hypothetical protein
MLYTGEAAQVIVNEYAYYPIKNINLFRRKPKMINNEKIALAICLVIYFGTTFAQTATVACSSQYGGVKWRQGQCQYGETMLGVGGASAAESSGERAQVACSSQYGGVKWRQGQCQYGETILGVGGTSTAESSGEKAQVACSSQYGGVKWRQGQCRYGETMLGVGGVR